MDTLLSTIFLCDQALRVCITMPFNFFILHLTDIEL